MKTNRQTIHVLVDRHFPLPRNTWARTSLWTSILPDAKEISIADKKRAKEPEAVRIDEANVVIVNWDAANGDYVCGSDDVLLYFQTQRDKRNALLRGRQKQSPGKLLCEFQCSSGVLHQGAYDAIFGEGEIKVVDAKFALPERYIESTQARQQREDERKWTDPIAVAHWLFRKFHPLLRGLPAYRISSDYQSDQDLFNFDDTDQRQFFSFRWRSCICRGWFRNWGKEWVPLLIAERNEGWAPLFVRLFTPPRAVLLAKCHEGGLMLASTMWMAVPGMKPLIDRIIEADVRKIARAHACYSWWRYLTEVCIHFHRTANSVLSGLGWIFCDSHRRTILEALGLEPPVWRKFASVIPRWLYNVLGDHLICLDIRPMRAIGQRKGVYRY